MTEAADYCTRLAALASHSHVPNVKIQDENLLNSDNSIDVVCDVDIEASLRCICALEKYERSERVGLSWGVDLWRESLEASGRAAACVLCAAWLQQCGAAIAMWLCYARRLPSPAHCPEWQAALRGNGGAA